MARFAKRLNSRPLRWIAAITVMLLAALGANLVLNWIGHLPVVSFHSVNIKGKVDQISPQALDAAVKQVIGGNFFTMDMQVVRAEFEKLTWVRSASVRRIWPDQLEVALEEHVPLARWGAESLLNTQGEIFHAGYAGELPHLAGPSGSEHEVAEAYRDFRAILKVAELQPREVLLSPRRAWQVKLTNGMVLDLGRVEMQKRLTRFVAVSKSMPELQQHRGRADLRYANGFALKFTGPSLAKEEIGKAKITK